MLERAIALALVAAPALIGCGASEPREADIYHDPALRPTFVEAGDESERRLLASLEETGDSVDIDGTTYQLGATYDAASGRRCRQIASSSASRLACETDDGWRFVPAVDGRD